MSETFLLRDVFNKDVVKQISSYIKKTYTSFEDQKFCNFILSKLEKLSFGERSLLITQALETYLPRDYEQAADILLRSLGPEIKSPELTGYDGFYIMPMGSFVSRNGKNYFDISMKLLYEMTKRFTSEGPIRTFIELYPNEAYKLLHQWTGDENVHVRRLVSEGTRPRLPLSSPLRDFIEDPSPVITLLTKLNTSKELLIRRSIANNLNDIAKDNPDVVTDTLKLWQISDDSKNMQWLIKHALRTLLKQGNPEALDLLGYSKDPSIDVINFTLHSSLIKIGEKLSFEFEIQNRSKEKVNLMIDYLIHFMKHSGKTKSKVFKLSKKKLRGGEKIKFSKNHTITQLSTRKIYPGEHQIQLQINGKQSDSYTFLVSE
ncbi:MAG: DNA alkylation repair protein [Candidatus Heimdallarchaeota archaeon]|nr:DNA alkylation repair protein [Candidatus Heimdallarchaeota archaeon]